MTFTSGSSINNGVCQQIMIVNDGVREETSEEFFIVLSTSDIDVVVKPNTTQIIIVDDNSELATWSSMFPFFSIFLHF